MGGNGSTMRKASFGLDEEEFQGVKLSAEVLHRMKTQGSSPTPQKNQPPPSSPPSPPPPPPNPIPKGPSDAEIQEEMRRKFEQEQALVQEARLAHEREREHAAVLLNEKGKTQEALEKAMLLARQLERKLTAPFYKEQLEMLEKKNLENYKQAAEQYSQAANKAEAHIRPRCTEAVCTELQGCVLQCYRDNPQYPLLCSSLTKQYMSCIQQAKKSLLNNCG